MKFASSVVFTCFIFAFWSQDLKEVNRRLRREYTQLKSENKVVLSKVIVIEPQIKKYKHEIDSSLKLINLDLLIDERMKLFHYRDSLAYGGLDIERVVAFYDVMPKNDELFPHEEISWIRQLQDVSNIDRTVILDSFPIEVENNELEYAIFSLSRTIHINTQIIEQFTQASIIHELLLERLSSLTISYNSTMTRVKSFNKQLADTMSVWRANCAAGKADCKVMHYYGKPLPQKNTEIYSVIGEDAEFPGGMTALRTFINTNLKIPDVAIEKGIEGKCYLQFVVSMHGNISNVKLIRGVPNCPECDVEAIRMVKSMPAWKPGKIGGKPVHSTYNLPVAFKLPK
jgi:hypothetical protein